MCHIVGELPRAQNAQGRGFKLLVVPNELPNPDLSYRFHADEQRNQDAMCEALEHVIFKDEIGQEKANESVDKFD